MWKALAMFPSKISTNFNQTWKKNDWMILSTIVIWLLCQNKQLVAPVVQSEAVKPLQKKRMQQVEVIKRGPSNLRWWKTIHLFFISSISTSRHERWRPHKSHYSWFESSCDTTQNYSSINPKISNNEASFSLLSLKLSQLGRNNFYILWD